MHDLAILTLASGSKGSGRLLVIGGLLFVIVVLAVGWIICAARLRAERASQQATQRVQKP